MRTFIALCILAFIAPLAHADRLHWSASFGWGVNLNTLPNYFSSEGLIEQVAYDSWRTQPVVLLHGHSPSTGPVAFTAGMGFGTRPTWVLGMSVLAGRTGVLTLGAGWGPQTVLAQGYHVGEPYYPGAYSQSSRVHPFVAISYRL